MSGFSSTKARRVYVTLLQIGWVLKRQRGGSHKVLSRTGYQDYIWAFHDGDEIGPKMLSRIAKLTGLKPCDLYPGHPLFPHLALAALLTEPFRR